MDAIGEFFGGLIKHFPLVGPLIIFLLFYWLWYATGGVERGEARRAAGDSSATVEVVGVPEAFGNKELFGSFDEPTTESQISN